jgi:hypothetical protein
MDWRADGNRRYEYVDYGNTGRLRRNIQAARSSDGVSSIRLTQLSCSAEYDAISDLEFFA